MNLRLRRLTLALGLIVALVLVACGGPGAPPIPTPDAGGQRGLMGADIDRYLSSLSAAGSFSGAVLVAYDGGVVLDKGYGLSDSVAQLPNGPATQFRISSLTKPFTAAAILLLADQGRLRVEDLLCRHLPACPPAWADITLQHLLTHRSGIPDYIHLARYWSQLDQMVGSSEELVALIARWPLEFRPGERFAYSNSGYVLLAAVVAQVVDPEAPADQAFVGFLHEQIFAPLGMDATGSEGCTGAAPDLAIGYAGGDVRATYCDPALLFGMGELYSTTGDLYRWLRSLGEAEGPVDAGLLATMAEPRATVLRNGLRQGYGYGWYVLDLAGSTRIWHSGATPGYRSFMQRELGRETIVIVLSNTDRAPILEIGREITAILIRREKDAPGGPTRN